jgi:hypothetical protein
MQDFRVVILVSNKVCLAMGMAVPESEVVGCAEQVFEARFEEVIESTTPPADLELSHSHNKKNGWGS